MEKSIIVFAFANANLGEKYDLDLTEEEKEIERIFSSSQKYEPLFIRDATFGSLLTGESWVNVRDRSRVVGFHFGGHAGVQAHGSFLCLSPETPGIPNHPPDFVISPAFITAINTLPNLKFIFLNGCNTLSLAEEISEKMNLHVSIGTTETVLDSFSIEFSKAFYHLLVASESKKRKVTTRAFFEKVMDCLCKNISRKQARNSTIPYRAVHGRLRSHLTPIWPILINSHPPKGSTQFSIKIYD